MFIFVFVVSLSSVYFISYECEGKITSPHDGTNFTFLPGSSGNITWVFDDKIPDVGARAWSFASGVGLRSGALGGITFNLLPPAVNKDVLPGVDIIPPATVELNNVSYNYDGIYTFTLISTQSYKSDVVVYIAKKPNVTFNCSSPIRVIEGDDVICVCRGEGGRPPPSVTWSKNGSQIGGIGKENKTLTLKNVDRTHSGIYKCEARSYVGGDYVDAKYIEVLVRLKFKPMKTTIKIKPKQATVGNDVEITCSSKGVPDPDFTIMHPNGTNITTTENPYTIKNVQKSDSGKYTCIATNELGEDTATGSLNVTAWIEHTTLQPTTLITTTTKDNQTGKAGSNDATSKTEWYIVVVSLVCGIIFGILLSYIAWCSRRRWFKTRKPEQNSEPQTTEVEPTYQELDLTKMNKEDNYQSLKVNAASNDAANEDTTYTQLTKTREVENNYQSLT